MQKIKKILKEKSVVLILVGIIIAAFFVRFYQFDQWLYFKMDQSRDALLLANAVENGPGYLPLLGPRVGAVELKNGFLRVGPIFYYFQYLAGVIFHSTEAYVFAYPDLFFAMLTIPLVYAFARLYFRKKHSLMVTFLYAFSFIIIQYSRFAWNPNSLQFFLPLSFYGMLRFFKSEKLRNRLGWLSVWTGAAAIGVQLHFYGFFTILAISGLMIAFHLQLWRRELWSSYFKKEVLKRFAVYALTALMVATFFSLPIIISDVITHGQNSKNFVEALGAKPQKQPLADKLSKAVEENLNYYCLTTTGQCVSGDLAKNIIPELFSGVLMILGFVLTVINFKKEQDPDRKKFLFLLATWLLVFTVLTIPVSYQLRPRFFIVVFAVPFIFLGFIFEFLEKRFGKKGFVISLLLLLLVFVSNAQSTMAWFKEQEKSQHSSFTVKRTLILKSKDGVTLGQLQSVSDWIYAHHESGKNLYYYIKPEHIRPINFLLTQKHDENLKFETMKINEDPSAEYFAVTPAKNGLDPVYKKFGDNIKEIESAQFGQLMVYKINVENRTVSQSFKLKAESSGENDRVLWKNIFNGLNKK